MSCVDDAAHLKDDDTHGNQISLILSLMSEVI